MGCSARASSSAVRLECGRGAGGRSSPACGAQPPPLGRCPAGGLCFAWFTWHREHAVTSRLQGPACGAGCLQLQLHALAAPAACHARAFAQLCVCTVAQHAPHQNVAQPSDRLPVRCTYVPSYLQLRHGGADWWMGAQPASGAPKHTRGCLHGRATQACPRQGARRWHPGSYAGLLGLPEPPCAAGVPQAEAGCASRPRGRAPKGRKVCVYLVPLVHLLEAQDVRRQRGDLLGGGGWRAAGRQSGRWWVGTMRAWRGRAGQVAAGRRAQHCGWG